MSQAHLLLQALYRQIHRAPSMPSSAPPSVAALARATLLTSADVRQSVCALAKQGLIDRGVGGEVRLTLAGLAVAVAKIDPQPAPAIREARRVAYAA